MTQHPGSHLDLDTIADLDAELLGPAEAAAARAHIDGCTGCRGELARLRSTRAVLSGLPPEQMPEPVAERVDAALRHEQNAPRPRGGTVVPTRRRRLWNNPAVAGIAAAAAAILLVGALVVGSLRAGHGSGSSGSSADRAGGSIPALGTPARPVKVWHTGRTYTAATLARLVPPLVTGTPPSGAATETPTPGLPSPATSSSGYTIDQLRTSPAAVLDCGHILAGGAATRPLAVDFGRYAGKPAAVFALPSIGHPESLDVWVVRSTCSASSLDYYFRRIPR